MSTLPRLPRERTDMPWPTLNRADQPIGAEPIMTVSVWRARNLRRDFWRRWRRDMLGAVPRGTVVGLAVLSVIDGFAVAQTFWYTQWHWAIFAGGIILIGLLLGVDASLVCAVFVGLIVGFPTVLSHPLPAVLLVAGGIAARCVYEALP